MDAEPLTFDFVRFAAVAAILGAVALFARAPWPDARHGLHAAIVGALSTVTAYCYPVPPRTALTAWAIFGERLSLVQLAGTALACLAVVLCGSVTPVATPKGHEN